MVVSIDKKEQYVIVNIEGRLDTTNYKSLEPQLLQLIESGSHKLILDCKKLDYVSSSGLRVFLVTLKTLTKLNGKLVFCNFNDQIVEIFEVSGFINIFNVCKSKEDALIAIDLN